MKLPHSLHSAAIVSLGLLVASAAFAQEDIAFLDAEKKTVLNKLPKWARQALQEQENVHEQE